MGARVRFGAILAVLLVVGLAGVAWGTDGQPLIAGVDNSETTSTSLTNTSVSRTTPLGAALHLANTSGTYTLTVANNSGRSGYHAGAILATSSSSNRKDATVVIDSAQGGTGLSVGGRTRLDGPLTLLSSSGDGSIPAGQSSIEVTLSTALGQVIDRNTIGFATLQQPRNDSVIAVVPHLGTQSFTIYLARPLGQDTLFGWMLLN